MNIDAVTWLSATSSSTMVSSPSLQVGVGRELARVRLELGEGRRLEVAAEVDLVTRAAAEVGDDIVAGVKAGAAERSAFDGLEHEDVRAVAAGQQVVGLAAVDPIVARLARQRVAEGVAGDGVGEEAAAHHLDLGQAVDAIVGDGGAVRQVDVDEALGGRVVGGVDARRRPSGC